METYKLNEMSELAIEYLFEAAKINIDGKHTYQVLGDIEPDGKNLSMEESESRFPIITTLAILL